jgi:pimeloyl-ACP methyl ester carboxylesterase
MGGEKFRMSIMVPDNLEDIQALKCSGASCSAKTTTVSTRICPGKQVENFRAEDVMNISAVHLNISAVSANLTKDNASLVSGNYSVSFGSSVQASISMVAENQPEPANRNIKIVGTPVVIKFNDLGKGSEMMNVTIPYLLGAGDDESSVAVYAKKVTANETRWLYVGGNVESINKVVTATVNLSSYIVGGQVTLAPMTVFCAECSGSDFTNPFTPSPDSRQAIIMIHGLWGVGKVWDGMITSFRLTNQPYQLWTFSYLVTKPVNETAKDLANYLESNIHRYDKIYIIGYSLGGLVTQSALRYAYDSNKEDPSKYTFIKDVSKVLIVATPNAGTPVVNYLQTFLSEYINSEATSVVPINSQNKELLSKGMVSEPVPNISYYALAGTKPYGFMENSGLTKIIFGSEPNDGLVGMRSTQKHGDGYLNETCINFWSRPVEHTLLIDDPLTQKIMGQIISSDIFKEMAVDKVQTNLFGYSNYFEMDIDSCSPDDLYVVIGRERNISDVQRAAYCACGNGVCDGLEDDVTCPADCLVVEKPLMQRIIERSLLILALLLVLFLVGGFAYVVYEHYTRKIEPELPTGFNVAETEGIPVNKLHYLKSSIMNLKNGLKEVKKRKAVLKHTVVEEQARTAKEAELDNEVSLIESKIHEFEEQLRNESASEHNSPRLRKQKP